ncbi:MAG: hypothetical protein ACFCU4_02220 [Puniceicoccaceae bacterium]
MNTLSSAHSNHPSRSFGVHFDFHAHPPKNPEDQIGAEVDAAMVARIIKTVRPDYIQCDCKGHPGWSSYPTKVGYPVPGLVGDPLRVWRDETARQGIPLYLHFSGVWDREATNRHPEWAAVDHQGLRDHGRISVFGPYVDLHLIPQLLELAGEYQIDGVWIDGECWALIADYSEPALQAWKHQTGQTTAPLPGEPSYPAFLEFNRKGFRRYVRHYVDTVHAKFPNFKICSNWLNSYYMPEAPTIAVDFLSGDFTYEDPVRSAGWASRFYAPHGLPWDLMAWGFKGIWGKPPASYKTALQLKQEAAVVIAQGGGFQAYYKQNHGGAVIEWPLKVLGEVGTFVRARQPWCKGTEPIPQVGLFFASDAYYAKHPKPFECWDGEQTPQKGCLNALLNSGFSVDLLYQYQLEDRLDQFPVVVYPEWTGVAPGIRQLLLHYVEKGGRLLLLGTDPLEDFRDELGITQLKLSEKPRTEIESLGFRFCLNQPAALLELSPSTETVGRISSQQGSYPAAIFSRLGHGILAATTFDFGYSYQQGRTSGARDLIHHLVTHLFTPSVRLSGSRQVEVVLRRLPGQALLHLINVAGPHDQPNHFVFDEIPPLGPLQIEWDLPSSPTQLTSQPGEERIPFEYRDGTARFTIPRLEIHQIIQAKLPSDFPSPSSASG